MNAKKYTWLFYFITFTILTTIAVQFFWNYKNYQENKQRVANEIQLSLDNAIEEYFAELAKNDFTTVINLNRKDKNGFSKNIKFDSVFNNLGSLKKLRDKANKDSLSKEKPTFTITSISVGSNEKMSKEKADSILKGFNNELLKKETKSKTKSDSINLKFFNGKKAADSLKLIKELKPIFFSVTSSFIEYEKLDSLLEKQLLQKGINIKNSFIHIKKDSILHQSDSSFIEKPVLAISKSTFVKDNEAFKLKYANPSIIALKRSFGGILLSLLLSLLIISCLFYLLKVINNQKELAEIKNDLISNITHEFKTPITTVSTALEAIDSFNAINDREKTKKYLSISSIQLKKLHQMVEKLLETATLDSEKLMLKKESINLVDLIDKLSQKHQLITSEKSISFSSNLPEILSEVDVFHFENAISNLIDNAVKYGGNIIEINVNSVLNNLEISVADNGKGIEKNQQEKIFDKFYRVPKGNTHDVKGFGIGLYYTKKIVEKHNGKIAIISNNNNTVFKITLPNE